MKSLPIKAIEALLILLIVSAKDTNFVTAPTLSLFIKLPNSPNLPSLAKSPALANLLKLPRPPRNPNALIYNLRWDPQILYLNAFNNTIPQITPTAKKCITSSDSFFSSFNLSTSVSLPISFSSNSKIDCLSISSSSFK